ncbi:MAG: hypothetical protein ACYC4L_18100 [Chloroflexota bacterium]
MRGKWVTALLAVLVVVTLAGCTVSPQAGISNGAGQTTQASGVNTSSRTSDGGGVTVKVTWQDREPALVFAVVMDTHSVDLDGYDLSRLAVLRTNDGREVQPLAWEAPKGGHHRQGKLTFPAQAADGAPLLGDGTSAVELVIRGVAGVAERKLGWEL